MSNPITGAPAGFNPRDCSGVSPECPVEYTTYGYAPNLGASIFLTVLFGVCLAVQLLIGFRTKTWTYTFALSVGTFGEMMGYIGRIIMHYNAYDRTGFKIQVICLIIAPSFIAAAIYLTLKHLVISYGTQYSRLPAKWYPIIFVGCDIISILLQAAGGGIASSNSGGASTATTGNDMMVAGIAFQVVTMIFCGIIIADYFVRRKMALKRGVYSKVEGASPPSGRELKMKKIMHIFCASIGFAYVTVLIRCIYRLPEMVGGWGNEMMRKELDFTLLDGMMIALATLALTFIHPGYFFPHMRKGQKPRAKTVESVEM